MPIEVHNKLTNDIMCSCCCWFQQHTWTFLRTCQRTLTHMVMAYENDKTKIPSLLVSACENQACTALVTSWFSYDTGPLNS